MLGYRTFAALALAGLAGLWSREASAQDRGRGRPPGERAQLEQQLRQRLATVVRERLGLDDEQMRRLSEVNQRYDAQRRDLIRREFELRRSLRQQLMQASPASDDSVAKLLNEQLRIQRARVDLLEAEQTDLARFLTPVQRARYLGIQEQMRRQVEQLRGRPNFMDDRDGPGPDSQRRRRPPPSP
ncbi:MAG TPA: hypothetical protein VLE53_10010 [Gemmatimonadaceae bacterium]|nr:hypothetical protein [Gemmatimonadaceae bacterium]